jgi:hypothetical protein
MSGILINPYAFATGGGGGGDSYRYFRLDITANNGANNLNISEFEVRTSAGGASVLTGGTPSASENTFPSTNGPEKAFDGSSTTFWATAASSTTGWLQYDLGLGNEVVAAEYAVQIATSTTRTPRDFTLQGSNDGSSWTVLDTRTSETWTSAAQKKVFTVS